MNATFLQGLSLNLILTCKLPKLPVWSAHKEEALLFGERLFSVLFASLQVTELLQSPADFCIPEQFSIWELSSFGTLQIAMNKSRVGGTKQAKDAFLTCDNLIGCLGPGLQ